MEFSNIPLWFVLIIASAVALGFYDICKKYAVLNNQVMPVLFFATLSGTLFFLICLMVSGQFVTAVRCTKIEFFALLLKSLLVTGSWICAYYSLRELPISIVMPIRATSPLWTLFGAVLLYHEIPNFQQGVAMLLIFSGYYLFSILGREEGISFVHHRGVHLIILATILGAASGLYDKYLLNVCQIPLWTVQFYFSVDLVFILGLICLITRYHRKRQYIFHWRWSIPCIGVLLIIADSLYFYAVSLPDIHISILAVLRRCSCLITFFAGVFLFKERNLWKKSWVLLLIFAGVVLLALA